MQPTRDTMGSNTASTPRPLRIAVASGKGGTGKTTVAVSLALSLIEPPPTATSQPQVAFLDCDVEGPNAHLYLRPIFDRREDVVILVPEVDASKCTVCGKCAEVCQYHAILVLGTTPLVFPHLCHGCGSCAQICPENAISEQPHPIGVVEAGITPHGIFFARGMLQAGEPLATPIIRRLKQWAIPPSTSSHSVIIFDAPPGTSCPVVETARGADFLLLVTEPTPFGLHDLRLAAQVAGELGIPAGVVINRDGIGDESVASFCASAGLPILMRIPFQRAISEGIAQGRALLDIHPEYRTRFWNMFQHIQDLLAHHSQMGTLRQLATDSQ